MLLDATCDSFYYIIISAGCKRELHPFSDAFMGATILYTTTYYLLRYLVPSTYYSYQLPAAVPTVLRVLTTYTTRTNCSTVQYLLLIGMACRYADYC